MASQYDNVVSVVSKSPSDRTDKDARSIILWFKKKSRLFRELHEDVVCDIIKNCEFTSQKKDDVLIRQGEVGNNFYILLRGSVSIYIQVTSLEGEDPTPPQQTLSDVPSEEIAKSKHHLDRSKFGNFIVQLEEGQSFGELALINKDCIRNATIIVDCFSDLLVVDRKLYNRSLKAAQTADFEQRNNFVSSSPLFNWWSARYKRQMAYSIVKETISFQEYIFKQGQIADKIYFIISGQAKIAHNPVRHYQQYASLYQEQKDEYKGEETDIPSKYRMTRTPKAAPFVRRRGLNQQKSDLDICLVGENEILGAAEFILGLKTYYQTVQTTEVCTTYSLDLKHYDRLIVRKHPKTLNTIESALRARLENRVLRMPEDGTSLFRLILQRLSDQNEGRHVDGKAVLVTPTTKPIKDPIVTATACVQVKGPSLLDRQQPMSNRIFESSVQTQFPDDIAKLEVTPAKDVEFDFHDKSTADLSALQNVDRSETEDTVKDEAGSPNAEGLDLKHDLQSHADVEVNHCESDQHACSKKTNRNHHSFHDWSSSDLVLADLETRLHDWFLDVTSESEGHKGLQRKPVSMRRVTIENGVMPVTGATVVCIRKRNVVKDINSKFCAKDDSDILPKHEGHYEKRLRSPRRMLKFQLPVPEN